MSGKGSRRRPASEKGKLNWDRYWEAQEQERFKKTKSREELYDDMMHGDNHEQTDDVQPDE